MRSESKEHSCIMELSSVLVLRLPPPPRSQKLISPSSQCTDPFICFEGAIPSDPAGLTALLLRLPPIYFKFYLPFQL